MRSSPRRSLQVCHLVMWLTACSGTADPQAANDAAVLAGDAAPNAALPPAVAWDGGLPVDAAPGLPVADAAALPTMDGEVRGSADAGQVAPAGAARASAGCGTPNATPSGTYKLDVDGTERSYIVTLPAAYDPAKPYRLVFVWHGLGVTATEVAAPIGAGGSGYFGMLPESGNGAIFVAGQGLPADLGLPGWPDTGGRDVAFARALLGTLTKQYCVDEARVFSAGMSYGSVMTNRLGCVLGGTLRAIAPMSGAGPELVGAPSPSCTGQVAVWLSHGTRDDVMPLSSGERSRDYWHMRNHCKSDTDPAEPSPCVSYRGCDAGFPVTWCAFDGGHERPSFSPKAIWQFFAGF